MRSVGIDQDAYEMADGDEVNEGSNTRTSRPYSLGTTKMTSKLFFFKGIKSHKHPQL